MATAKRRRIERKACLECGKTKPLTAFVTDNSRPDKRTTWCRDCRQKRAHEKYQQYRDARVARQQAAAALAATRQPVRSKARPKRKPLHAFKRVTRRRAHTT